MPNTIYRYNKKIADNLEECYYVGTIGMLSEPELKILRWLLTETFEPENLSIATFLTGNVIEIGPRLNAATPFSTNAVAICHSCGLTKVVRVEFSRRYATEIEPSYDIMREMPYSKPITSFETGIQPEPVSIVRILEQGAEALKKLNESMGLGMDDWDIKYYTNLVINDIRRNLNNVECFQLGQSNSEHSRHWFFRGRLIIDGQEIKETLFDIVKTPLLVKKDIWTSRIAFSDNSSAIRGFTVKTIIPAQPGKVSPFKEGIFNYNPIFTAETHNFPTGVCPFPGAETGTGGRIRDIQATGIGGLVVAGTAAYCVGQLHIPGYELPWESRVFAYPENLALPLKIEIDASNGASDYGNKFGEPVIQGFTRSFGLILPDGTRREWLKPIMFTGGVGQMNDRQSKKGDPKKGMLVVKIGGWAYRIGVGGGAASSMIQGENKANLDFNAVQRGDAEMEQKMNRVVRACVEMGDASPIKSIHDQGAGGSCNVVTEIINPAGGIIYIRRINVGDPTMSVLEIWGAEYQECNALLIRAERIDEFEAICAREKVNCERLGVITGDGKIVLQDDDGSIYVNLELAKILGDLPQKTFEMQRAKKILQPFTFPIDYSFEDALTRVLHLLDVGSKRFLTNKVDRSVTGLIARQQCSGPLQLTVSDVAVVAQSHFGLTGTAIAIGEQPIKGLISPAAMARMSVAEAMTNLVWARVTDRQAIRCSVNCMWAAKLPGEGADLYDAYVAMRDIMIELDIAPDGGKDSLSMAAKVNNPDGSVEIVKAPGALVISAYAACSDITKVITPDIKVPGKSHLLYIDLGGGKYRLGGSAFTRVYGQIGDESPDIDDPGLLAQAFDAIQELIDQDLILAGHDISDGGLVTTILEMLFAGDCGADIMLSIDGASSDAILFAEEAGLVIEFMPEKGDEIQHIFSTYEVPVHYIGFTKEDKTVTISQNGLSFFSGDVLDLRASWEETSYELEKLQADRECVEEERINIYMQKPPVYQVSFIPEVTPPSILNRTSKPEVAIIRAEGSNGDREMASAFYLAGFEPWDVTMSDLIEGRVVLDRFRGSVFVGGFSNADALGSAKGWAASILFNEKLREKFDSFNERSDTFSLGVCNGCQLMALLGWVPYRGIADEMQPRFIHNNSGRFESRFSQVSILKSNAIMLQGMEGSSLGIWCAHGEGKFYSPNEEISEKIRQSGLAPIRYVDDRGMVTDSYPFNPNGSEYGIAGLCSPDGRQLAMMPHPERGVLKWQWPWMPEELRKLSASPWLKMFQNAREWCEKS